LQRAEYSEFEKRMAKKFKAEKWASVWNAPTGLAKSHYICGNLRESAAMLH
jgi:hypothetical protein